jgi:hypothetical protein
MRPSPPFSQCVSDVNNPPSLFSFMFKRLENQRRQHELYAYGTPRTPPPVSVLEEGNLCILALSPVHVKKIAEKENERLRRH